MIGLLGGGDHTGTTGFFGPREEPQFGISYR